MHIKENISLAQLTSLGVGGVAEKFILARNYTELTEVLKEVKDDNYILLGYGCNSLISDDTIKDLVICCRGGDLVFESNLVIADAGVWWDDLVLESINRGLWGIELTSEIPGSVGAATYINITAYGQSLSDRIVWVEVWDKKNREIKKIDSSSLTWGYKKSVFQHEDNQYIILRIALKLETTATNNLTYQKALDVADELNLNPNSLVDRRKIIIEARYRAGSIWHKDDENSERTAGSFFRNPLVSEDLANKIISYDESGKTAEQIKNMNKVHGGDEKRVSAAHVMLASGFKRGQKWNLVKLNDKNVLKIETLPGATAKEVYDVMREIQNKCKEELDVWLEPEVQLIGNF